MLAAVQTGHVGLNVTDLDRSIAFYGTTLGFALQEAGESQGRRWAFMARDGHLMITLWQQASGRYGAGQPGLHHLGLLVDSMDEVDAVYAMLTQAGIPVRYGGVVPHGAGEDSGGLFFEDPDGIRLEVYANAGAGGAVGAAAPFGDVPTCGFF
jgi:catechol 2,3-dioxygenase-like lactoylglutathione lyase family enzyme